MVMCAGVVAVAPAFPAHAGGQLTGDNGSQGMQRAGAFVAKADDPTALYYNPAALTKAERKEMFIGVNVVQLSQSFQRAGNYKAQNLEPNEAQPAYVGDPYPRVRNQGGAQPIPSIAFTIPTEDFTLAAGVFAPHGYGGRSYPDQVRTRSGAMAPAPQRYDIVSQSGTIAFPTVGGAVRLSDLLSIGGRVSWGFAQVSTRRFAQGLPSRSESPGRDTDTRIVVKDDKIIAYGLGAHYRPSADLELGLAYTSPIRIDARGTSNTILGEELRNLLPGKETTIVPVDDSMARCERSGSVGAIKTCVELAMPQTATLGVRWISRNERGEETSDLELDVRWENWAAADEVRVIIDGQNSTVRTPIAPSVLRHRYKDVYSVRVGGSAKLGDREGVLAVRYGVAYETGSTEQSWSRLDVDTAPKVTLAAGLTFAVGSWRVDVGLAYIDASNRYVHDEPLADSSDVDTRVQPDITAPLLPANEQPYHPFNAGRYESSYLIGSFGMTRSW